MLDWNTPLPKSLLKYMIISFSECSNLSMRMPKTSVYQSYWNTLTIKEFNEKKPAILSESFHFIVYTILGLRINVFNTASAIIKSKVFQFILPFADPSKYLLTHTFPGYSCCNQEAIHKHQVPLTWICCPFKNVYLSLHFVSFTEKKSPEAFTLSYLGF